MEENTNRIADAVNESVESLKKLIATIAENSELKKSLEETLAKLTKKSEEKEKPEKAPDDFHENPTGETGNANHVAEDNDNGVSVFADDSDLSDIFTEDAIAGMVVGFVAGAALVGDGVLLHKVLSK